MDKPKVIDLYEASVTDDCERMLVTLLSGMGPWKESVCLVGGLAPRYLVRRRPPEISTCRHPTGHLRPDELGAQRQGDGHAAPAHWALCAT